MDSLTQPRRAAPETARQRVTALYQEHALGLVRLAVLMVGDQPTAEDVVQDAFLALYRRWPTLKDPDRALSPHVRIQFTFKDDGPDLRFTDQRTFGHMCVVRDGAQLPAPIAHIAPDPFEPAFDAGLLAQRLRRRRTGIKRALLDQSLVSGIGNIYADEALWRAGLHWARESQTLRPVQITKLFAAVQEVFAESLSAGGTTFDSLYVNVNGQSGYFERSLNVYGRAGQPCRRCGTPVRRDPFMNRSAFSCPKCQPRPRTRL